MPKTDAERHEDRRGAIEWARGVLADPQTVIYDCETAVLAGGDPTAVDICEIGLILADGEVVYDTLVGVQHEIAPEATAEHGITFEMCDPYERFWDEPFDDLSELLPGKRVIAYNAEYDREVLRGNVAWCNDSGFQDFKAADAWLEQTRWECVTLWYAQWIGEWDDSLGEYRRQKQPGSGHRALADCYATLALLHTMAKADPAWQPPIPPRADGRPSADLP
ncbi:3'-5' exonuclease [Actinocorallia sp. A-T 12471]|uniref:3'-5' exonuclease n=1 Tax=Actinocorallia sp. A-T 12471 TaxID=3089813 RepID=UPI0029CDAD67|nr:3'-5' exonuclease [Actinocorallia sp. A-T 12471]MDX6740722.1 3'-5' exonuclease [Actinocorallia sp. A-T 12471]